MSLDGVSSRRTSRGPPLVRIDTLVHGQIIRPYVGHEAWEVVEARPVRGSPDRWGVVLRNPATGEERRGERAATTWLHGDWEKPEWWPEGVELRCADGTRSA